MSGTLAPPSSGAAGTADALFAAARRRRRRRRLAGLAILALAAAAGVGFTVARPDRAPAGRAAHGGTPRPVSRPGSALAGSVAWVADGRLHLGDLATGAQRVIARSKAYPVIPLVQAGGHLYWAAPLGARIVVQELNPATGRVRSLGPGRDVFSVFTSANGRHVFFTPTATTLVEVPARGSGARREFRLPPGWYMPDGSSVGVDRGILVKSKGQTARAPTVTAVWSPATGALKVIGTGLDVLAAYTPAGGHDGFLAWLPAACAYGPDCPLKITNTAALTTRTVRSPLRHGFALGSGVAFSPNGTQLAVFAGTSPDTNGPVRLAMVNTRTGALRLSDSARLAGGCPPAWARWLPDGRHLITGGIEASYVVNTATMSARPLYFMRGRNHYIVASQDINYSTVVVPPRQ